MVTTMKSYTLRLDPDEVEAMEREAERQGFSSRTEYMRHILRNRPAVEQTTADSLADEIAELRDRVARIEAEVDE